MRIGSIDQIRGLSLMGILLVNAIGFAMPLEVYTNPAWSPLEFSGLDRLTWWVIETFFHEKFISLFSMLFGVSLFLVQRAATHDATAIIWRRLLFLLAIGIFHGALIWDGDILLLYAVTGMVFRFVMHRDVKSLLAFGIALFVVGSFMVSLPLLSMEAARTLPMAPTAEIAAKIAMVNSGFWPSVQANFSSWCAHIIPEIIAYMPITLGLMMIGLGLFKAGFFEKDACLTLRKYLRPIALIGTVLIGLQAFFTQANGFDAMHIMGSNALLNRFLSPIVALGYAAVLVDFDFGLVSKGLESLGRLAFTHYLSQSLIMTTIFLRLGHFGTMNYAALAPIVVAIWIFQWAWGTLWQRRFRYGPLEYVWRCVTHAKILRLTR